MRKIQEIFYRVRVWILWFVVVLVFLYILLSPDTHFKIGNVFFGGVPALYNVTLANFFFARATNPIVGSIPPFAHHQLSRTYFIRGQLDVALAEAQKELEIYPEHWNTYYIIGLTLGYMNREKEAIEAFGTFIEHKPESWAAKNDKAWLQFRIGDIDGALATLLPVATSTENPWVQNTYGTLLLNKGRYQEAREAFENAQRVADSMTEEAWGRAYPGNDPRVYGTGLQAMRLSIASNLKLLEGKQ